MNAGWGQRMRRVILCTAVMLSPGCSTTPTEPPAPKVNLSGFPPAFQAGYADGCESASGRQRRDEERFATDRQYASGWRDGLDSCRRRSTK